jgi:hypothetical protein
MSHLDMDFDALHAGASQLGSSADELLRLRASARDDASFLSACGSAALVASVEAFENRWAARVGALASYQASLADAVTAAAAGYADTDLAVVPSPQPVPFVISPPRLLPVPTPQAPPAPVPT